MKDIVNVLNGLGAEIDTKSKIWLGVTLNGRTMVLHLSYSLLKEVMQICKFLNPPELRPRPIRFRQHPDAPIGGLRLSPIIASPDHFIQFFAAMDAKALSPQIPETTVQ